MLYITYINIRTKLGLCHEDVFKTRNHRDLMHFCVHKHRASSPFMMMSTDVYTTMMMVIMPHMTLRGLLTSKRRYGQLARI